MLTVAFGETTMNRTQVQLWYNRLKKGQEDVNDGARPDRSSTSATDENIEAVRRKWLWIIVELLLKTLLKMLAYRSAYAKKFLGMF